MRKRVQEVSQKENIFLPFEKKWVAVTRDYSRVVAHADTIKELAKKLGESKSKSSVITYVNSFTSWYSP